MVLTTDKTTPVAKRSAMLTNELLSSPPRLSPGAGKERRNPSITPRKFKRFFTPRSRVSSEPSAARRALRDLAAPALNRCLTPSSPLRRISEFSAYQELPQSPDGISQRSSKRRKFRHTPEPTPEQLPTPFSTSPAGFRTPDSHHRLRSPIDSSFQASQSSQDTADVDEVDSEEDLFEDSRSPRRLVPLHQRGLGGHLAHRMTGSMPRNGRQYISCPPTDWRMETADFCSKPEDAHLCKGNEGAPVCIPFCVATCNNSSKVAVGDEEGFVRLLDSNKAFSDIQLSLQVHSNAVIDLAFSEDDHLLATASGDQTGKVIDVGSQTPVALLAHHTASLKQVRFQPGRGSNSVLATSSRDGSVQIWDLRCHGGPVQEMAPLVRDSSLVYRAPQHVKSGCVVNSIYDAHGRAARQARVQTSASGDVARLGEVPGRIGEVSVTALQFLPEGREHLLLSACEADAVIRLWDVRSIHSGRHHKHSTPVSFTTPPDSHTSWRPFGISSMALSGDGARLYAACKDNTVYAYSTTHLVLGHATELAAAKPGEEPPRRKYHGAAHEGLGPLYGFRHPMFHATSFYVKAGIRKTRDGRSELLAVGSNDGCAVLFPTDERYLRAAWDAEAAQTSLPSGGAREAAPPAGPAQAPRRPGLQRANSITNLPGRLVDTIPIARTGTPLVRGHSKEVGALAWTSDGKLVTAGDDYVVRCWGEDRDEAKELRTGGEGGGRRWASGWADVEEGWQGDEDDW